MTVIPTSIPASEVPLIVDAPYPVLSATVEEWAGVICGSGTAVDVGST